MLTIEYSLLWISLMIAMSFLAYKAKVINKSGILTAVPIGFIILYFGEVSWFFILILFFIIASVFTRYKYREKQRFGALQENDIPRNWKSVLANGLPLAVLAILYYISDHNPVFMLSFVGSISFALSDTLATELGLLSKEKPRSILTGEVVNKGQSGGITLYGEIAAIISSLVIGSICGIWFSNNRISQISIIIVAALVGGVLATNLDSILGSTIQAKYKCVHCKKRLEKRAIHCNRAMILERGISIVDNNVVNLLGMIIGALISASFVLLLE
jgi:uncharacterized protein (TIGR00297 family)